MPTSSSWLSCILVLIGAPAFAFPDEADWADLLDQDGTILADPLDTVSDPDLVGSADSSDAAYGAVAQWYADETNLYFRMRMDKDPQDGALLEGDSWAILVDVDGNLNTYEYSILANDYGTDLKVWENSIDDGNDWSEEPEDALIDWSDPLPLEVLIDVVDWNSGTDGFNEDADFWLWFQLDRDDLSSSSVIENSTVFRLSFATDSSSSLTAMSNDLAGVDNINESPVLASAFSDTISIDEDDDGLTVFEEEALGTDPTDADTDGDGLSDGDEVTIYDTNPLDSDTDGDGADDATEVELGSDPNLEDTDEDGVSDGDEIEAGLDPTTDDSDGDGISDLDEISCVYGGEEGDRDGDGILDVFEGLEDTDEDGELDFCDPDDDGDGIATATEGDIDTDEDGTPNYLDTDSDEDGALDVDEGVDDDDCDEILNYVDAEDQDGPCGDLDDDGLTNEEEADCGTDPENPDTDGDGLLDGDEDCDEDSDGDGINDALDPDSNGDDGDGGEAFDSGEPGNADFSGGHYTGGSCSVVPLGSALLPAFLAGLATLRRRRELALPRPRAPAWLIGGSLLSALAPSNAKGQEVNAQRFSPAAGNSHFVLIEESKTQTGHYGAGLWFNYADDPLVYRHEDGSEEAVLSQVATTDLLAWGRLGPVQIGLDLPLHLQAVGHGIEDEDAYTLGDLQFRARMGILEGPISLGVSAWGGVPTGNGRAWLGAPGAFGGAIASLGKSVVSSHPIELAAHLGFQAGASDTLDDLTLGSQALWAVGAHTDLSNSLDISASLELSGEMLMGSSGAPGAMPAEALLAFHLNRGPMVSTLGVATGLSTGLGSPDYRIVMGIRFTPGQEKSIRLAAEEGQTFTQIRIIDADGNLLPGARLELLAGPEDELGRWTAETGVLARNLLPASYRLLVEAEGYGTLTTSLMVPDQTRFEAPPLTLFELGEKSQILFLVRDSKGQVIDGAKAINQADPSQIVQISDGTGVITLDPDSYNWIITADGFQAATSPARVSKGSTASVSVTLASTQATALPAASGCLSGDYIRIKGTSDLVFFDTGEHVLRLDGLDVLNSVAKCVTEHPDIVKLEIIGHADPRGDQGENQQLSERRAEQVKDYLETRLGDEITDGLELSSRGMGEQQLLQGGDSETALQTDRRVEFRVHLQESPAN